MTRAGRIPISPTAHREKPLLTQHQSDHREAKARPLPRPAFWCFLVLSGAFLWSLVVSWGLLPLCPGVVLRRCAFLLVSCVLFCGPQG